MWFGASEKPSPVPQVSLSPEVEHVRGDHWKKDTPDGFKNPWPSAKAEQVGGDSWPSRRLAAEVVAIADSSRLSMSARWAAKDGK